MSLSIKIIQARSKAAFLSVVQIDLFEIQKGTEWQLTSEDGN